ncbi:oligosaccharide flippase family protein [Nocardioides sp. YIM B13467]|uniref:oligosaccharide flippase family protein n=1 Tax=Nocardioides sp. YIM B13467 TaxID=3366294 RepID=UPI00366E8611
MAETRPHTALAWSIANTAVTKLGTMVVGILVARLLGPESYGTYAVAFLALMAVLSFNELGVSLAVVRWKDDPREIAPTVTTISVVASLLIAAGMVIGAGPYARAMGEPDAAVLVAMFAVPVVLSGITATPAALLQRNLMQGKRMLIDQMATIVAVPVMLGLALAGAGPYSLVIGHLLGVSVTTVMFLRMSPLPWRMGLSRSHAVTLLRFGAPLAVTSILVFAVGFADQIVIGSMLGATALGFYVVAFNLSSWPVTMLSRPLRQVTPVIFARLQRDPAGMRHAFTRLSALVLTVTLPGCSALAALAPEVIGLVYGDVWQAAAAPLLWLGALAVLRISFELAYDFLVIAGSTRSLMTIQIVWLIALVPALLAGAAWDGVGGVGLATFAVGLVVILPLHLFYLARAGVGLGGLAAGAALPALGALAVWAAAVGMRVAQPSVWVTCAVTGLVLAAVWAVLLRRRREDVRWFRSGAGSPTPGEPSTTLNEDVHV